MKPPEGVSLDDPTLSVPTNTAYERFCRTRQVALLAWRDWLSTNPDARDVEAELSGTCSAMEQLRELHRERGR